MILTETNETCVINSKHAEIVGLTESSASSFAQLCDDCCDEDRDNQNDKILSSNEEAMRKIANIVVPADDPCTPLHNLVGRERGPTTEVRCAHPSQYQRQPVIIDLDDPVIASYVRRVFNADINAYQKTEKGMVKARSRENKRSVR